jgi:hypothetical protein
VIPVTLGHYQTSERGWVRGGGTGMGNGGYKGILGRGHKSHGGKGGKGILGRGHKSHRSKGGKGIQNTWPWRL